LTRLHPQLWSPLLRLLAPEGVLDLEGGEKLKTTDSVERILSFLSEMDMPKDGLVVAIGGGTICDAVSLAATLFRRGVPLALIPTTLLAQIDAAVGGKNGVNFGGTKNLLGHFYHPDSVICDPSFLRTLRRREFVGGLAEALKVLAVSEPHLFYRNTGCYDPSHIATRTEDLAGLVADCLRSKLALLADDPYEVSSRRLLNYGHAFAHNFEEESGFSLSHGEAVLAGMTIENAISCELNIAGPEVVTLQRVITDLITPACRNHWIPRAQVSGLVSKLRAARRGRLNLVCLRGIGDAEIFDDVDISVILAAWDRASDVVHNSDDLSAARQVAGTAMAK